MSVLVLYASKYGATQGIAERIAMNLEEAGLDVTLRSVKEPGDLTGYDAVVLGSAVYFGSWLKEATRFVERHQVELAERPVWLFSSGPLGTETTDAEGNDMRETTTPKQIAGFNAALHPRDHRVFYGKLDRDTLGFRDRLIASLPAFPGTEGEFRDWDDIDQWAGRIAEELAALPTV